MFSLLYCGVLVLKILVILPGIVIYMVTLLLGADTVCEPEISNIRDLLSSLSLRIRPGSCLTK